MKVADLAHTYTDFLVEDIMVVFFGDICIVSYIYLCSSIGILELFGEDFLLSLEAFKHSKDNVLTSFGRMIKVGS